MILSDRDIRTGHDQGHFTIKPWHDNALQPASYEVHLDWDRSSMWSRSDEPYVLAPSAFRLAHTIETITLGPGICAQLTGKSSLGRLGLLVHATAGYIDPGFTGQIVLEMKNISNHTIFLGYHQPVAQLIFHRLSSEAQRPYGTPGLGSHYQGQTGDRQSYLTQR